MPIRAGAGFIKARPAGGVLATSCGQTLCAWNNGQWQAPPATITFENYCDVPANRLRCVLDNFDSIGTCGPSVLINTMNSKCFIRNGTPLPTLAYCALFDGNPVFAPILMHESVRACTAIATGNSLIIMGLLYFEHEIEVTLGLTFAPTDHIWLGVAPLIQTGRSFIAEATLFNKLGLPAVLDNQAVRGLNNVVPTSLANGTQTFTPITPAFFPTLPYAPDFSLAVNQ